MDFLKFIIRYFKYYFSAKNEHSLHSPFLFKLYTNIIKTKVDDPKYSEIENQRKLLSQNVTKIEIEDFGAGSKIYINNSRTISQIANNAQKPAKFGQLLFRLIEYFQPKTVLDLGTSLGITTLYQSAALEIGSEIYTFEGCPQTANEAKSAFEKLETTNIFQIIGNIDDTLPKTLAELDTADFVFFDANHRFEPTVRYFEKCLKKATLQSVFVFDDIHWSPEMEQAWEQIKQHPKVMISIDLFWIGLIFFRTNQPKQDFVLRF